MVFEILIFVFILTFLVFIHELGHFFSAKYFKIDVKEFGLGLPPRAWSKKIGETIYSLNWLPIGGFVQIKGETPEGYDPNDSTNFLNKKCWQRAVVLTAGVFMNLVFAVLIFYLVLAFGGWKSNPFLYLNTEYQFPFGQTVPIPNIAVGFSDSSAGKDAGIMPGDQIVSLKFNEDKVYPESVEALRDFIKDKADKPIEVEVYDMTKEQSRNLTVIPRFSEEINQAALGLNLRSAVRVNYDSGLNKVFAGFIHPINLLHYNVEILKSLVGISIEEKTAAPVAQSLSGPVGIFSVVNEVINSGSKRVFLQVLDLAAIISLSLGVMNLLPIPALDGGRLVFVISEMITGKKPSPKLEAQAHQFGFFFLILMIIAVTFKDVLQLF
jgi:regulator of sigma E protease